MFQRMDEEVFLVMNIQLFQQCLGRFGGGGGVLTRDQQSVDLQINTPIRAFAVMRTRLFQFIFEQKRHDLGQLHGRFLSVGKAGYLLALYQRITIGQFDVEQRARRMTNQGHGFPLLLERFEQGDGFGILGQIPQRAMSARIKNRIIIRRVYLAQFQGVRQLLFERFILVEPLGKLGLSGGQFTGGINRGCPPLGEARVISAPASANS